MASVEFKKANKSFGKAVAMDDVSVKFESGTFGVLLGPSGCGKTTTLRSIAGLETLDSGEVFIGDRNVTSLPPQERNIAMVFQNYILYPHMTVFDNMGYGLKARKTPKEEIEKRVRKAARLLEMEDLLDRKPSQLSGGQAQRTAIGRAITREPDVFLMDEPLANLDARLRLHMRGELTKLQRKLDATFIYVTHDQAEALAMADKILIMNQGEVQQIAPPKKLYDHPSNVFVGRFIGELTMNIMNGTLIEKNGSKFIDLGFLSFPVSEAFEKAIAEKNIDSSEIKLGVRPEDVSIHLQEEPGSFEGRVSLVELMGNENIVSLDVNGNVLKSRIITGMKLAPSDCVWVKFNMNKLHFFERKTGKRLV